MKITGTKLAKWQVPLLNEAISNATSFLSNRYDINKDTLDLATIRCSNSCRFAKYTRGYGIIRINLPSKDIYLYDKKSLGKYNTKIKSVGYKVSWTCQLIHELTHLIQDLKGEGFGEVEPTRNELDYLKSIGIV